MGKVTLVGERETEREGGREIKPASVISQFGQLIPTKDSFLIKKSPSEVRIMAILVTELACLPRVNNGMSWR